MRPLQPWTCRYGSCCSIVLDCTTSAYTYQGFRDSLGHIESTILYAICGVDQGTVVQAFSDFFMPLLYHAFAYVGASVMH